MKKNFSLAVLVMLISFAAKSFSPCRIGLIVDGFQYSWSVSSVTVSMNPGDTLILSAGTGSPCGNCVFDTGVTNWTFRGITTYAVTIAATDTGVYTFYAESGGGIMCAGGSGTFYLTITYATTSAPELAFAEDIRVSPTLSTGIFKINAADKNFKQLLVTDCTGKIIFITQNNFSEINLTRFASGIYFYAITDEWEKVWRGRIVKE